MQVHSTTITAAVQPVAPKAPAPAPAKVTSQTEFSATQALEDALRETPDVRASEVEQAAKLVESRQYPPPELTERLARFLAQNLEQPSE